MFLCQREGEGEWVSLDRWQQNEQQKNEEPKQGTFSLGCGRRSLREILPHVFAFAFVGWDYKDCEREEGGDKLPLQEDQERGDDAPSLDLAVSRKSDGGKKENEKD